jgi:hypothetical protein
MKMVVTLLITVFSFWLCSAPPPSKSIQEEQTAQAITEIKRIEKEKQFSLFIEHLGLRESGNQDHVINSIGCMGTWQIAPGTLRHLGYDNITPQRFRQDPHIFPEALQRQILIQLFEINSVALKDYMDNYIGLEIDGVLITKAGILASAHLGGAGGVKSFLLTMGKVNKQDLNKTSIKKYMKEFSNFNI